MSRPILNERLGNTNRELMQEYHPRTSFHGEPAGSAMISMTCFAHQRDGNPKFDLLINQLCVLAFLISS